MKKTLKERNSNAKKDQVKQLADFKKRAKASGVLIKESLKK